MHIRSTPDKLPPVLYSNTKIGEIFISTQGNEVTVQTSRLILRSLNQINMTELTNNFNSLLGNPMNVGTFMDGHTWKAEEIKEYLANSVTTWNNGGLFSTFSAHETKSQAFVGCFNSTYHATKYENIGQGHNNVVEIGYIIGYQFWGTKYGSEMAEMGKHYIKYLNEVGLQRTQEIVATAHPDHIASITILKKTLKNKEASILQAYNQPRLFFFKPIKIKTTPELLILNLIQTSLNQ